MRKELDELELDGVTGGCVVISKNKMMIGFSTTGEKFNLTNCSYNQARDYRDELLEANANMSDEAFDKYCKQMFQAKGWI